MLIAGFQAKADDLLEQGPNYFIVEHEINAGIGFVTLHVDTSQSPYSLKTTILDIETAPGWFYRVEKAGGSKGTVEILFWNNSYELRFKARYAPGKTVIDGGTLRER